MYNYYNKQSHDAYEKGKAAVNRADIVVAAPSALEALGCEGYDRFDGNVMSLLDRRGLSLWLPFGEKERLVDRQRTGDLKAQKSCVQMMRWYKNHQAEFFQDDGKSPVEDGCVLSYIHKKRLEGNRVLVISQSEELAGTLMAWNRDDALPPVTIKQISRYGYLRNHQAYYNFVNDARNRATEDELRELEDFDPLITN